jgi:hypothetical protein
MCYLATQRLQSVMKDKGYPFYTKGDYNLNIVGVRSDIRASNSFDDHILCLYKEKGKWKYKEFKATTDCGNHWLKHPMTNTGSALLVPNHYRGVYKLDLHKGQYKALCQRLGDVEVYRDNNKDLYTDFDPKTIEKGRFGINIHRSNPSKESKRVDKWSAGCQVFAKPDEYSQFIKLCEKSASIFGNKFSYSLLTYKDFENE